jgi:hypothetical protein
MSYLKKITESIQQKGISRHFLFWTGIVLLTIPQSVLEREQPFVHALVYKICVLIPQVLASYFFAYFVIPKFLSKKKHVVSFILLVVGTYFFAVLARVFTIYIGEALVRKPPFEKETMVEILTQMRLLILYYVPHIYSTVFIFLAVKFFINYKTVKENELLFMNEKVAAELKTLKAQLNPHFLFNTLNNIYVLSLDNSPKTPKSIEKLSKILDHILYRCNTKYVSLSSEIELIENYIELEKLRYDDRLQVHFKNELKQDGEIAPLILLSLVEHAFKHGAGEDSGSPKIDICLENSESTFKFVISNSVAIAEERTERTPIGLKNIKKQLNLIYPERFELQIDNCPTVFKVTVSIQHQ